MDHSSLDGWPTQRSVRCVGYFGFLNDYSEPLKPTSGLNGPPAATKIVPSLLSRILVNL